MKTRTELLLDFMLALSQNPELVNKNKTEKEAVRDVFLLSAELTDKYLAVVGGYQ